MTGFIGMKDSVPGEVILIASPLFLYIILFNAN